MKIFVVVNRINEIGSRQTTAMLVAAMLRKDCRVYLAEVDSFSIEGTASVNRFIVHARDLCREFQSFSGTISSDDVSQSAQRDVRTNELVLEPDDLILIRTNPGRDLDRANAHDSFLEFCKLAESIGVKVVNDPTHVRRFASKAALALASHSFRPSMIVSCRPHAVADFVTQSNGECVVKPTVGSRGQDVIRVLPNQANLLELIEATFGDRNMIAQTFVHSDQPGDKRVLVVGGSVLEVDGRPGGIHRIPAEGDFRANIHAGGTAHPLHLTDSEYAAVQHAAQLLNRNGIWLAGVDLIGDKIIEFNVFSTGGLYFAELESKIDFSGAIVDRLLQYLASMGRSSI